MSAHYSIIVAPSARQQAKRIAAWWEANREKAPILFAQELEAAFARVATAPTTVRVYRESKGRVIRRLLLPRTCHHLFFEVNEAKRQVQILAVWHTARGRGPRL
ncbi:MAG TPA: type II toxin-antitoxin system RelE/ParE family toxin [Polyangia bacterium]|jgi:plasmid stabilization system protein ParE|nr:type II toxin-antitoxin system RelE/ParE family toxin [Polyangia bacterium]